MRITYKLLLISELVLLLAVVGILLPARSKMWEQARSSMENELRAIAGTAALHIDGDLHAVIRGPEDIDSSAFTELRDSLRAVRQANGLPAEHIYTFFRDGDQVRFAVMTHEVPFTGDPYTLHPEMVEAFERGVVTHRDLYRDEHGEWMSVYAPIRDSSGAVVGILDVDKESTEYFAAYRAVTMLNIGIGLVVLAISSILGWNVLQFLVIRPMGAIRDGVNALARQEFGHQVKLSTKDEFEDLGDVLNDLSRQLNLAQMIQASLFPKFLPESDAFCFSAFSRSCDATGGDYYDAFALEDGNIVMLVADVSGHGIGPSLLMASFRATLRALSATCTSPGDLVKRLERQMEDEIVAGRFITLILAVLHPDGRITYTNAGHSPAMIKTREGVTQLEPHRTPVGIVIPITDEDEIETTVQLQPGDRIFFSSDGLTEAFDAQQNQFGLDRVTATVRDEALSCHEVVKQLDEAVWAHCGGPSPTDDVTMLCVDVI